MTKLRIACAPLLLALASLGGGCATDDAASDVSNVTDAGDTTTTTATLRMRRSTTGEYPITVTDELGVLLHTYGTSSHALSTTTLQLAVENGANPDAYVVHDWGEVTLMTQGYAPELSFEVESEQEGRDHVERSARAFEGGVIVEDLTSLCGLAMVEAWQGEENLELFATTDDGDVRLMTTLLGEPMDEMKALVPVIVETAQLDENWVAATDGTVHWFELRDDDGFALMVNTRHYYSAKDVHEAMELAKSIFAENGGCTMP